MPPDNAQPPVTAQREDGWYWVRNKWCGEFRAWQADLSSGNHWGKGVEWDEIGPRILSPDQLEQHEREMAALQSQLRAKETSLLRSGEFITALGYTGDLTIEAGKAWMAELRQDRDALKAKLQFESVPLSVPQALIEQVKVLQGLLRELRYSVHGAELHARVDAALAAHKPEASKEDGA